MNVEGIFFFNFLYVCATQLSEEKKKYLAAFKMPLFFQRRAAELIIKIIVKSSPAKLYLYIPINQRVLAAGGACFHQEVTCTFKHD
jgi:hypothetical protein